MESKAKLLGHPIHQMLIVLPLGLFIAAIIFDVIYLITDNPMWATVSFWNVAGGVISGLVAAVFGFIDWWAIPGNTRAKRIGALHGFINVVVVVLFIMSWLFRLDSAAYEPSTPAFLLALLAVALSGVSGWLGGELVDRLAVGVDPGAHLNAPSSLSNLPASANQRTATYDRLAPGTRRQVRS